MDALDEVKNDEEYQMDLAEIKDSEEHAVEMLVEQPRFLEPICPEEVNEDTRVYPRVGDEYQVEVPNLATEEERVKLRSCPVDDNIFFGFDYPVSVGLAIPVTWSQNTNNHVKTEQTRFSGHGSWSSQDECNGHIIENIPRNFLGGTIECDEQDEKSLKSAGQDIHCLQNRKADDYIPVPGMVRHLWTDEEAQTFLLGLYIFGKNLVQVTKFMQCKTMGEVLSYYYGEFFRSDAYNRWAACRKVRSRRCILGLRIFSGTRQQELLSRILAGIAREAQDPLLEVFKTFNEGTSTFEEFILSLRSTVGAQVLVEAVGIGKGKYDLTGFALDPSRNHGISNRAEIPIGKACSSLSSGDIIKFLTGDFRLSKAKSNDLFWEAVWPRLLARGWHSEQPKDSSLVGKHALVFLIPGVKKFSRKKLVRGNHYFDSVSDVLSKVASEPKLLEFGVESGNGEGGLKIENGWIHDSELDKSTVTDKKSSCFTRPSESGCSPELMKFTVVDTSVVQGEEPCKVRSLRNLPADASHGYMSSPHSEDSGSVSSEEQSDSEDSSQSYEHVNTKQNTTDAKYVNEKKCKPPAGDRMDVDVLPKNSSFSGTLTSTNGHMSIDQGFSIMNNVFSSTATVLPVGTQRVHATNSSTEINFQFDRRVTPEPQILSASSVSKRRRLVSCKNERTVRRNTAVNRRQHGKQVGTTLQHDVSGANEASIGAKPFIWGSIPKSSTTINFDMGNTNLSHRQLYNVPPTDEKIVYKEKSQDKHVIDLNIPQVPSDYESAVTYVVPSSDKNTQTMGRPIYSSETNEMDDCLPDINTSCNELLSEQLSSSSRRQSTRSRPPTTRALEALACGFIGTKQKGAEAIFPCSSRSSRPVRRPRRLADAAVPFPSDGEGSSSHFTDPAVIVDEWHISNPQYQVLDSIPADKSTDKATHELFGGDQSSDKGTRELFGADKSTDKGTHELFGIP
uniref:SANT domain-containing protein n=1 Tax=Leersia perrieri TaxID=77586 RepID=A0A0D9X0H6_9ORYZ